MPTVALTDRFVSTAKPGPEGRVDYFDAATKGLAVRVAVGGRKTWTFHFTSPKDGKRARLTIGTYPATSLAGARGLALEAKGHVEAGRDPRDVFADQEASAMTVTMLIGSYLDKYVRPELRTAAAIERRLNKNVVPIIGGVKIADLHKRDVTRVIDPIVARGKRIEAGRVFEDVRAMIRWAVKRGDLDHSPLEGMEKPSGNAARERILSDDEIRKLWNGLPEFLPRSAAMRRIVKLLLVTGQRVGEVAGMRRDELDLKVRVWALPGSRTKNGKPHLVPLSDLAVSLIEDARTDAGEESSFVFPWGDEPLSAHAVAQAVGRRGQSGLAPWTAHDLRRTVLTNMAGLGIAPIVLGHVANHITTTKAGITLGVYVKHAYEREKREALDLWADRLAAIVEGSGADVVPLRR